MSRTILFLGYGYTAAALARRLREDGWQLSATARTPEKAARLEREGVAPVLWTGAGLPREAFDGVEAILVSTPPTGRACPSFAAAADLIADRARAIKWIGYLSSNGVYGDHGGAWVDEDSRLLPTTERARRRIAAEAEWAGFGAEWALPVVIFRLPGIYGPDRSALDAARPDREGGRINICAPSRAGREGGRIINCAPSRAGWAKRIVKEGQVFNRMHVEDIAAALHASLDNPGAGELFNLSDDEPAPPQDVIAYACELLGAAPPPLIPLEEAELSDMARSFYADNKRVSNRRMKEALGARLRYPTYKEGLKAILESGGSGTAT